MHRFFPYPWFALLAFLATEAGAKTYKFEAAKIRIDPPEKWADSENLYGIPLVLVAPETQGFKPNLSVMPTGMTEVPIGTGNEAALQKAYRDARETWLSRMGGKSLQYYPYHAEKWAGIDTAHVFGYRYQLKDQEFLERSYYAVCGKKLYHLKALMLKRQEAAIGKTMEAAIRSFQCLE